MARKTSLIITLNDAEKWLKRFLASHSAGLADRTGRGRKPFFPSGRGGPACQDLICGAVY